ncbi:DUF5518 domain-containing protein [Natronolimnohabitans sp. A-GB9]|uniref:DUF5518 domain-containing protein n=1 Tax=Natronolimnohabitans sp. A-GB9 TaxID=3069757 RepID=UPI0027B82BC2|nr:DUF5518 domain-containing protein [Natronolimnohabitans sp. A-GB9]MDQ2050600.1 DUF5518 domain-containing protein [Natronolimnohabitans sp. A-GB9]
MTTTESSMEFTEFRTAILLGIASIPFTIGINLLYSPTQAEALPVFVACVISGYLYQSTPIRGTRVGIVTGLVGGVPILVWQTVTVLTEWWGHSLLIDIVGDSGLMAISSAGAAVITFGILVIVLSIIGYIGGFIGSWLNSDGSIGPKRIHRE